MASACRKHPADGGDNRGGADGVQGEANNDDAPGQASFQFRQIGLGRHPTGHAGTHGLGGRPNLIGVKASGLELASAARVSNDASAIPLDMRSPASPVKPLDATSDGRFTHAPAHSGPDPSRALGVLSWIDVAPKETERHRECRDRAREATGRGDAPSHSNLDGSTRSRTVRVWASERGPVVRDPRLDPPTEALGPGPKSLWARAGAAMTASLHDRKLLDDRRSRIVFTSFGQQNDDYRPLPASANRSDESIVKKKSGLHSREARFLGQRKVNSLMELASGSNCVEATWR